MKLLFLFLFMTTAYAIELEPHTFTSPADAKRYQLLTNEIRCVVCQNQSIADSNAVLANDLREKVYQMVQANKSNDEIKLYLTKRYGDFILLKPRFNQRTAFLWIFPFAGLTIIMLVLFNRRRNSCRAH